MERFRNVAYLEHRIRLLNESEQEKLNEQKVRKLFFLLINLIKQIRSKRASKQASKRESTESHRQKKKKKETKRKKRGRGVQPPSLPTPYPLKHIDKHNCTIINAPFHPFRLHHLGPTVGRTKPRLLEFCVRKSATKRNKPDRTTMRPLFYLYIERISRFLHFAVLIIDITFYGLKMHHSMNIPIHKKACSCSFI